MDRTAVTLAAVCALTIALAAQQPLTRFEVASIKPTLNGIIVGDGAARIGWDAGGRYRMVDGTVGVLLRGAYPGVVEVLGLPGWATSQHFDVEARAEREPTQMERATLLRQLLADRFKAVARVDPQERPTYALKVVRADGVLGQNLKPVAVDCASFLKLSADERGAIPPPSNGAPRCGTLVSSFRILSGGTTMSRLAGNISGDAGRVVRDETGLVGDYELTLEYGPDVSVFTALREQLGLTLEPSRAALAVLIVEKIEPPTPD